MRVVGLDLSLASTGVAGIDRGVGWVARIRRKPDISPFQLDRMRGIRDEILTYLQFPTDLVVVEAMAISRQTGQHLTRAGLWHLVVDAIDTRRIPVVAIAPTAVKKYATGKGNADKDAVLAAVIKRHPTVEITGNDEADALTLAAMGADHLGQPLAEMPAINREALGKVAWPALISQ